MDDSNDTGSGGLYNPSGQGDRVSDYVDYDPWDILDSETITETGSYTFNEAAENGDGHHIDIDFTSLSGSGVINVQQSNCAPLNPPVSDYLNYVWNFNQSGISSFLANVTFHYTDIDESEIDENNLQVFYNSGNGWVKAHWRQLSMTGFFSCENNKS